MAADVVIRRARSVDLPRVGELAGRLVRMHHDTDPNRFFLVPRVEEGYASWFAKELKRPDAVILVAAREAPDPVPFGGSAAGTSGRTALAGPAGEALAGDASARSDVVGYTYGTLEGRDWNMLLDAHGALHDVFVAEEARRAAVGLRLVEAMIAALEGLGARRVVLSTMVSNDAAQRLFRRCGFRATMIEMTRSPMSRS